MENRGAMHYVAAGVQGAASAATASASPDGGMHVLITSNGSPYQNYQTRILYATYRIVAAAGDGGERFRGFTRILHRTVDDELMGEVPTFRAVPLTPACDAWCEYPVSDRADAVRQFLEATERTASLLSARWLYMVESDYVFMEPLRVPSTPPAGTAGWGYPFDYINPGDFVQDMRRMYPEERGPVTDIQPSGPAPILLHVDDWRRVTPRWEAFTALIEGDEAMKKRLGWVREMYAFSAALAVEGIRLAIEPHPATPFIAHLPLDHRRGQAHAYHYTLVRRLRCPGGGGREGSERD